MKTIAMNLIQVILCSGLLYGYYHILLRNRRFHSYNRYYLLFSVLISLTVPLLHIPLYFSNTGEENLLIYNLAKFSLANGADEALTSSHRTVVHFFTLQNILLIAYGTIFMLMLVKFLKALLTIRRICHQYPAEKIEHIRFINTTEPAAPFSFFRLLFWNRKIRLESPEGRQVFRHEWFHITQGHSWDILFLELVTMLCWMNPFFYIIKKEIKTIHEFLADEFASRETERWQYAELLLTHTLKTNQNLLATPFFQNQLKRRIAMITSSTKPGYQYLRKVLVLPVAVLTVALFAFTIQKKEMPAVNPLPGINKTLPETDTTDHDAVYIVADSVIIHQNDKVSFMKKPADTAAFIINGRLYKAGELQNKIITATSGAKGIYYPANSPEAIKKYGDRAKNGAMIIEGQNVQITDAPHPTPSRNIPDTVPAKTVKNIGQALVVLDGNIIGTMPSINLDSLVGTPASIKSMTVLKGSSAISKYGTRGKNGVIEIITKNQAKSDNDDQPINGLAKQDPSQTSNESTIVFETAETAPSFPGGQKAWIDHLVKSGIANTPVDHGAPVGNYKVVVQFIVEKDGTLSSIKPLTKLGYGMEDSVIKLLSQGPKWIPAIQNGKLVRAYVRQPVTFVVSDGDDETSPSMKNNEVNKAGEKSIPQIYPNPTTNTIVIPYKVSSGGKIEIRITDLNGRLRSVIPASSIKGANNLSLNIAALPKGIYMVSVIGNNRTRQVYKMIKQ